MHPVVQETVAQLSVYVYIFPVFSIKAEPA